jgi:hypothetical protein
MRPVHDKFARESRPDLAPPRLRRLRHGIFVQPVGAVLVQRRNRTPADAGRRQRLPVPGLFAEGSGAALGQ